MIPFAGHIPSKHAARRQPSAGWWSVGLVGPFRVITGGVITNGVMTGGVITGVTILMLALGGCGLGTHQNGDPDNPRGSSGMIVDGEDIPTGDTDSPTEEQAGTILFMASPGNGRPAKLISRTNSITTAPTAEFLARQILARKAIAAKHGAPVNRNGLTAPLVIEADDHQETPILLPTQLPGQAGAISRTDSHITIQRQSQGDGKPTLLKIIETP